MRLGSGSHLFDDEAAQAVTDEHNGSQFCIIIAVLPIICQANQEVVGMVSDASLTR